MQYKINGLDKAQYILDNKENEPKIKCCNSCECYFYSDEGDFLYGDFYCNACIPRFKGEI